MAKALLVLDMPENCAKCPVYNEEYDRCEETKKDRWHCYDGRPDWCPIITSDYFTYYDTWKNLIDFLEGKCRLGLI